MLSQTVEYALRAAVHLARQDRGCTSEGIAQATKVPPAYMSKVMQSLTRAGLVRSRRGVGGGFVLAKAPDQTTVLEIVNAVDPLRRIRTCPLELPSHGDRLCALHRRLDNAIAMLEETFGQSTLADILTEEGSPPLCDVDC